MQQVVKHDRFHYFIVDTLHCVTVTTRRTFGWLAIETAERLIHYDVKNQKSLLPETYSQHNTVITSVLVDPKLIVQNPFATGPLICCSSVDTLMP